jgi:hypothetical protein
LKAPANVCYAFDYRHYRGYRLALKAQTTGGEGCLIVQINWHNTKGRFLNAVQMRFKVPSSAGAYDSNVLTDAPEGAAGGVVYLIPEGGFPITVNSLEIFGCTGGALQKVLDEYKKRWPR